MSNTRLFTGMKSRRMAAEINSVQNRVVYATPGLQPCVADALIAVRTRLGPQAVTVVLDCNEDTCRLGYGYAEAIRKLTDAEVDVRQSPGLRVGLLICDDRGWLFSPVALYVEDETPSDETPNATRLVPEQVDACISAIGPAGVPNGADVEDLNTGVSDPEIGVQPLTDGELEQVEKNLEIAPPLKFDVMRQVRVFQPYIQYVELSLKGCSINRHVVSIPNKIFNRDVSEELERRLHTKFDLIDKKSDLSGRTLRKELDGLRKKYLRPLGQPWGSVILRGKRNAFDAELETIRQEVAEHQKIVQQKLQEEIDKSMKQIVNAFWREVADDPPGDLFGQIMAEQPSEAEVRSWLRSKLEPCFPRAEQVVSQMRLECVFRDVTFETLNQKGFAQALKKAYPLVPWDKPFSDFQAAKQKRSEIGPSDGSTHD